MARNGLSCADVPLRNYSLTHSLNCTKFGKLILRKIVTIAGTRCDILKPKMCQIRFWLGLHSRPRSAGGAYSAWNFMVRNGEEIKIGRGKKNYKIARRGTAVMVLPADQRLFFDLKVAMSVVNVKLS